MMFKAVGETNQRIRREANSSAVAQVQPDYSQIQNELVIFNYAESKREMVLTCNNQTKPTSAQTEVVITTRADLDKVDSVLQCKRELLHMTFIELVYQEKSSSLHYLQPFNAKNWKSRVSRRKCMWSGPLATTMETTSYWDAKTGL